MCAKMARRTMLYRLAVFMVREEVSTERRTVRRRRMPHLMLYRAVRSEDGTAFLAHCGRAVRYGVSPSLTYGSSVSRKHYYIDPPAFRFCQRYLKELDAEDNPFLCISRNPFGDIVGFKINHKDSDTNKAFTEIVYTEDLDLRELEEVQYTPACKFIRPAAQLSQQMFQLATARLDVLAAICEAVAARHLSRGSKHASTKARLYRAVRAFALTNSDDCLYDNSHSFQLKSELFAS